MIGLDNLDDVIHIVRETTNHAMATSALVHSNNLIILVLICNFYCSQSFGCQVCD